MDKTDIDRLARCFECKDLQVSQFDTDFEYMDSRAAVVAVDLNIGFRSDNRD